jgi:predicted nucleic acid-binding protein
VADQAATRGLLDTNIIIDLPFIAADDLPDLLLISAITLGELSAAPHHAKDLSEQARRIALLQQIEATFEAMPFDSAAARAYGRVWAGVIQVGRHSRRRVADLMIAAVALSNGLTLYTSNPDDFVGLEGLLEVRPVTPKEPLAG